MSSTAHARQHKNRGVGPDTKAAESTQKAAYGAQGAARMPAWTSAWGDRPAIGLISPIDLQAKGVLSQPGDPYEQEADQVAKQVMHLTTPPSSPMAPPPDSPVASSSRANPLSYVGPMIQRAPVEGEATSPPATDTPTPEAAPTSEGATTGSAPEAAAASPTATPGLIVEDSVDQLQAGQMKKSDFLAQLRDAVCTTTGEALKGTIWSAAGCPWIDHWFSYYSNRDSQQIERALRRYAPETANATSASDYIPIICERVRRAIAVWSTTGEVTGVPEGMELPAAGLLGMAGSIASGIASVGSTIVSGAESVASGIASAGTSLVRGVGSALSGVGRMLFKGREGGAREVGNPRAIQGHLSSGSALDSRVKAPMEQAFGVNFSQVRVHTDATAAGLSESLNARAFTIGQDVAFGPGEYRPGTLVGDALIAHELAHVVQQRGANSIKEPLRKNRAEYNSLEEDADRSAVGAVVSLWSGTRGMMTNIAQNAMPRLKSGLALQRCPGGVRPQLRNPQDVLRESGSLQTQILSNLEQRGKSLDLQTQDPSQKRAIVEAEVTTESDLQIAISQLESIYRDELDDAGNNVDRRIEAQQRFEEQLRRLQESYIQQFEMTRRWGIQFTTGRTQTEFSRMPLRVRYRITTWSLQDLNIIDSILRRVPRDYLNRIMKIQREPGTSSSEPAAWTESTRILHIYDAFFGQPEELRIRYLLHEIGHSTDPVRRVGLFDSLPNEQWMRLSDWRTSTSDTLAADLGLSAPELSEALERLEAVKRSYMGFPRPILIKNRMVVPDRYERGIRSNQFLHYDASRDGEFVTPYARSHPADDLAESFAHYMLDRADAQRKLDVPHPGGNKWNYLVQHYPRGLQPPP